MRCASISLNRNCVHCDASALSPGGVRIGAPSMTTLGCNEEHFAKIAEFSDRVVQIALKIQAESEGLKDFELGLTDCKDISGCVRMFKPWPLGSASRIYILMALVAAGCNGFTVPGCSHWALISTMTRAKVEADSTTDIAAICACEQRQEWHLALGLLSTTTRAKWRRAPPVLCCN